jgi:exopolyphosphatase / guanosine-5'-triphosphate,3'-diphosphate pyrophosphatase
MAKVLAAIDVGTNTARLLIGCLDSNGTLQPLLLKRKITRLGGGFSRNAGLSAEAMERTITAMQDFAESMKLQGVIEVRAVATSAVRDALNGRQFTDDVLACTGIRLEVIDGNEEALLTLKGVLAAMDNQTGDYFVFDVGGGSTEYTFSEGEVPLFTRSLPLGVVRLTEGKITCAAITDKISRELVVLARDLEQEGLQKSLETATLVGTAGTATTLAAIHLNLKDYDYRKINNYCLSLNNIKDILTRLLPLTPEERLAVPGLEKGREDLIIAGIFITIRTMELFGFKHLKVSDFGLLEGLLATVADHACRNH